MRVATFIICSVSLLTVGCITPHQERSGKWIKPAQVEIRSSFGTNQSGLRLERCNGPEQKKPWYKFYFEGDFDGCVYLTKAEQDEWEHASSRGAGPEIVGALIMGGSIGAGTAVSGGAKATAGAAASASNAVTQSVIVPRGHRH